MQHFAIFRKIDVTFRKIRATRKLTLLMTDGESSDLFSHAGLPRLSYKSIPLAEFASTDNSNYGGLTISW